MNESVTVTIVAGNKKVDNIWPIPDVPKCKVKQSFKRTVTINEEILTPEQVALLKAAANNVKYIAETSDIKLQAEEI